VVLRTGVNGFGGQKILLPLPELEPRIVEPLITVLTTLSQLWAEKSTDRTVLTAGRISAVVRKGWNRG
jgi:hypothetical protein